MSHANTPAPQQSDRPSGLALGARFGEGEAEAWVKKLDQMDNEQLADVLGFIIGKLCKNRP